MGIYKASGTVNGIYLGATSANKAYKGSTEIWGSSSLPIWLPQPSVVERNLEWYINHYSLQNKDNLVYFATTYDETKPLDETVRRDIIFGYINDGTKTYRFTDANNRAFSARKNPFDSPVGCYYFEMSWILDPNTGEYYWQMYNTGGAGSGDRLYVLNNSTAQNNPNHLVAFFRKSESVTYDTNLPTYVNWIDLT